MDALPAASSSERVEAPAPADDQVRSRQTIVHIVDVFSDVYIWIFLEDSAALCKHLRKILHPILSGRVDVVDLAGAGSAFFGVPCNQVRHRLIDRCAPWLPPKETMHILSPTPSFFLACSRSA